MKRILIMVVYVAFGSPLCITAALGQAEVKQHPGPSVWQAKHQPKDAVARAYPCRIVSHCDWRSRRDLGKHMEMLTGAMWRWDRDEKEAFLFGHRWRFAIPLGHADLVKREKPYPWPYTLLTDVDVDGDGETSDDYVLSLPFSLTKSLSPPPWPASNLLPESVSQQFYGGATWRVANLKPNKTPTWIHKEFHTPYRDDYDMEGARLDLIELPPNKRGVFATKRDPTVTPDRFINIFMTFLWTKKDFLNGGSRYRVSFDENSRILLDYAHSCHWPLHDQIRLVVQDGEQLYIAQYDKALPNVGWTKDYTKNLNRSHAEVVSRPTQMKWAKYNPKGIDLKFDHKNATFESHEFSDVRAVGFYLAAENSITVHNQVHIQAFEVDAVVSRPAIPSLHMDMKKIKPNPDTTKNIPPFYLASCETPYSLSKMIYRWGTLPINGFDQKYVYDKSGDMGSMRYLPHESLAKEGDAGLHKQDEPVTNLTFYDMLAMCNTLSEKEGKTPCYYLDPEFKKVFRNQHLSTRQIHVGYVKPKGMKKDEFPARKYEIHPEPIIHVKWVADGYRLPTASEWFSAFKTRPPKLGDCADGWVISNSNGTTHTVGSYPYEPKDLRDMIGNVWELVWTYGNKYDPKKNVEIVALGGSFLDGVKPKNMAASPYGDKPFDGHHSIGFRLACRDAGLEEPQEIDLSKIRSTLRVWAFRKGQVIGKKADAVVLKDKNILEMVKIPAGSFVQKETKKKIQINAMQAAKYEVTFAKWKKVYDWAVAKGYNFSMHGDMGSMYWFDHSHHPNEPVTNITWYDCITWCNALSEMEGRTPVYYADKKMTTVYRNAWKRRPVRKPIKVVARSMQKKLSKDNILSTPQNVPVAIQDDADGYRLAVLSEYRYLSGYGTEFEKDFKNKTSQYVWDMSNSLGTTHQVGKKKPNSMGLCDLQGNVMEFGQSGISVVRSKDGNYWVDKKYSLYRASRLDTVFPLFGDCSWLGGPANLDVYAFSRHFSYHFPDWGFRVVRNDGSEK